MNREEIIHMMQSACDKDKVPAWKNEFWTITQDELERFAALVAAAEREACAALVETLFGKKLEIVGSGIAAEIRARGEK